MAFLRGDKILKENPKKPHLYESFKFYYQMLVEVYTPTKPETGSFYSGIYTFDKTTLTFSSAVSYLITATTLS